MTDESGKPRRIVTARRGLALGTLAAAVAGGSAAQATAISPQTSQTQEWVQLASGEGEGDATDAMTEGEGEASAEGEGEGEGESEGEGEGEGEGASLDPEAGLVRDLAFMQGHLRAGLALYEAGDLKAARTHIGHPIEEKYDAVASAMEDRGLGRLGQELKTLAQAAENGDPVAEVGPLHDRVVLTLDAARQEISTEKRLAGLIDLVRVAGDEYTVATEGGKIANLHEYQDSWGFLQVVSDQLAALAEGGDDAVADAVAKMQKALGATGAVYGDLQGEGDFEMDPGVIYGAAARMEFAKAGLS
ncbi:hypothetical protein [Roseovarius salis]|uniref:hypothetical protein n=1 Tax=Roseovarius salis TaxID=3376063 RepID=UPI0037CC0535